MKIGIPDGVRVFNREETFQIRKIENQIKRSFELWGYEEIILPSFEYFDIHERGIGKDVSQKAFKFVDRNTGDILVLRADFTSQIARYFSSLKKKDLPKRYYYSGNVFRYASKKSNQLWEKWQTGIELIGVPQIEADAEIIAVASKTLKNLGINNFQIDINNIKIFKELKSILSLSDTDFNRLMGYIKNREIYNLKGFCNRISIDEGLKEFIINIPKYQGKYEFLIQLKDVVSNYPGLLDAINQLEEVYNILKVYKLEDKIIFDLGEPQEFSYYTGIIFEIFVKGFPKPLGKGGRYDNLIEKYNGSYPATGFAFDLLSLWDCILRFDLFKEERKKDFYVIDITKEKRTAYELARMLREKGYTVTRDIIDRNYKESIDFAFREGFKKVVLIGMDKDSNSVYIYSTPSEYEKLEIKEFLEKV